jgi:hypothetical protein
MQITWRADGQADNGGLAGVIVAHPRRIKKGCAMLGKIDYDVLCSASYDALRGLAPGWCDVVLVSQLPLIYKLSADDLGEFGEFSVRKRPGGQCEIDFRVTFTEAQPIFTEGDPVSLELLQLPTEERRRRIVELSDDEETRRRAAAAKKLAHLRQVEKLYFEILARDDVFPLPAQPTPVDLGQAGAAGLPKEPPQPPEPKEKGGKIYLWLDWYHQMIDNGFNCTLGVVAEKSHYSEGYIKQIHMRYVSENGSSPNQNT